MMKLADVSKWKIKFGKYKNTTFGDLVEEDSKYVEWLLEKKVFETDDPKYKVNNEMIIEYLLKQV